MFHVKKQINKTFIGLLFFSSFHSFGQLSTHIIDQKGNPNEPSLAIHPKTKHIVSAANIDNFYMNAKPKKQHSTSKYGVYGDPVLHYSDTTLFFAHLSKTPDKTYGDWFDRIVVQKITDPKTWQEKSYSVGYNEGKMQDKPWLSSDNHSTNFNGNVYVTWTEFDKYNSDNPADKSRIRFSRYEPNNDSFSTAITLSDTTGDCMDGDHTLEGATTATGKNGEIYAAWAGHYFIWLDKSTDGGKTWGTDQKIASQPGGWDMDMPHIMRANGMPFIVSDTARDIIYVTWADELNGNADVWLLYSKDQGQTWSERVNMTKDSTGRHQYFPNITINQETGEVFVAYYDFRGSPTNAFYNIGISWYAADGLVNETFATPKPIALPGKNIFFGDYLDIDVQRYHLTTIYTANAINNTSEIHMATSSNYLKSLIPQSSSDHAQSTIALQDEGDSLNLWCNMNGPTRVDYKIKIGEGFKTTRKIKHSILNEMVIEPIDEHIATLNLTQNEYIKKAKIITKDLNSGEKQKYKLQFYISRR
jgi:hypothetical protein